MNYCSLLRHSLPIRNLTNFRLSLFLTCVIYNFTLFNWITSLRNSVTPIHQRSILSITGNNKLPISALVGHFRCFAEALGRGGRSLCCFMWENAQWVRINIQAQKLICLDKLYAFPLPAQRKQWMAQHFAWNLRLRRIWELQSQDI